MKRFPKIKARSGRLLRTLLPSGAILFGCFAALIGVLIYKISYPGVIAESVTPSHYLLPSMDVEIPTGNGDMIAAWWIPGLKFAPGIILAPGYGMSRSDALSLAVALQRHGFNLLIYAQRGCGADPLGASTLGAREAEDMATVVRYLRDRPDTNPERMGIWGVDIGAYAALKTAGVFKEIEAVAADSAYEGVRHFMNHRLAEDFGIHNGFLQSSCWQLFRLIHLFDIHLFNENLQTSPLSPKAVLFIRGEQRPDLAAATASLYKRTRPQKELLSVETPRIHAMSGENLKNYDRQVAGFFHLNLH